MPCMLNLLHIGKSKMHIDFQFKIVCLDQGHKQYSEHTLCNIRINLMHLVKREDGMRLHHRKFQLFSTSFACVFP